MSGNELEKVLEMINMARHKPVEKVPHYFDKELYEEIIKIRDEQNAIEEALKRNAVSKTDS